VDAQKLHVHDLDSTSKMSSTSTGVPSGRPGHAYTNDSGSSVFRRCLAAARSSISDLRLIADVSRSCYQHASRTIRLTLSSDPMLTRDSEAVERRKPRRRHARFRVQLRATRPMNLASRPSVGSIPVRNSKFPVCTASA